MFSSADTIVAIATPAGRGGLGVVRLSGTEATRVAGELVGRAALEPRRATFARIREPIEDGRARALDQVVVTWFARPHSYTGEDVVELSAHGSPVLLQRIVELAMAAGARLAEPGEFTLRAHLHGRIDLVQAEAVADLVDAVTPLQARVAMDQLEGTLTQAIGAIDRAIFDLCAKLEASLDFPDEGFHFLGPQEAREELNGIRGALAALSRDGRSGRVVREGRLVVITGPPNAGKSSLFNALVGSARAIVTDVPGTTRDVLTERVDIGGLLVTLVDTAGIRDATDAIEAEGVERALRAREVAALEIALLDGAVPLTEDDRRRVAPGAGERLVVISKTDLPRRWSCRELQIPADGIVDVSAVTGRGLDRLRASITQKLVGSEEWRDTPQISNVRHLALLDDAGASLERAQLALESGATEELVLVELGAARRVLEEVTGRRTSEDLLRHIFSRFCVGK